MKLEASTRLKLTAERYGEYLERLTDDLNVKSLGSGAFAEVFQHPTLKNVVVKVLRKDPNYLRYAEFCRARPRNPWLPKIAAITPVQIVGSPHAHLVFLEKLNRGTLRAIRELKKSLTKDYGLPVTADDKSWFTAKGWRNLAERTKDKGLAEFALFAGDPKNHRRLDLHEGNLMLRGTQLVFTDPLS